MTFINSTSGPQCSNAVGKPRVWQLVVSVVVVVVVVVVAVAVAVVVVAAAHGDAGHVMLCFREGTIIKTIQMKHKHGGWEDDFPLLFM